MNTHTQPSTERRLLGYVYTHRKRSVRITLSQSLLGIQIPGPMTTIVYQGKPLLYYKKRKNHFTIRRRVSLQWRMMILNQVYGMTTTKTMTPTTTPSTKCAFLVLSCVDHDIDMYTIMHASVQWRYQERKTSCQRSIGRSIAAEVLKTMINLGIYAVPRTRSMHRYRISW